MAVHELKIWPPSFAAMARGAKRFEARWGDDRRYAVGDWLVLREWDPAEPDVARAYTGRCLRATVTYVEHVSGYQFGQWNEDPLWLLGLGEVIAEGVEA
jgi:hypothetical protein